MKRTCVTLAVALACGCFAPAVKAEAPFNTPYYFGPNAYPVPEVTQRPLARTRVEAGTSVYFGRHGDVTANSLVGVRLPLWTPRANYSVWANIREFYRNTDASLDAQGVTGQWRDKARRGSSPGDIYVSTDMLVLKEGAWVPDVILRATLKTASGDDYEMSRHYDSAAYNFDLTAGKTFNLGGVELRPSLMAGFVCWHTRINQQDDALLYGLQCSASWNALTARVDVAGYHGRLAKFDPAWHDSPAVLRSSVHYDLKRWTLSARYEHGLRDYPYNSVAGSVAFNW